MNADINGGRTDDKAKYYLLTSTPLVTYILYLLYKIVNPFFNFKAEVVIFAPALYIGSFL